MMRTRTRLGVLAVSLLAAIAFVPTTALAQYPVDAEDCVTTRDTDGGTVDVTYAPGEELIVEGDAQGAGDQCFDSNTSVSIFFIQSEVHLATVTTNPDGSYSTRGMGVEIPEGARAGSASIRVSGQLDGESVSYSQAITIAAAGPGLPTTGADIALIAVWGVVLVAGGSLLISATWRRYRYARVHDHRLAVRDDLPNLDPDFVQRPSRSQEPVVVASAPTHDRARRQAPVVEDLPRDRDVPSPYEPVPPAQATRNVEDVTRRANDRTDDAIERLKAEVAAWRTDG